MTARDDWPDLGYEDRRWFPSGYTTWGVRAEHTAGEPMTSQRSFRISAVVGHRRVLMSAKQRKRLSGN